MIQYLGASLDNFPGPANQMWCFAHTVNLIAKSIMKPFDAQKAKDIKEFNDAAQALANLAEGSEQDRATDLDSDGLAGDNNKDKDKDNNVEDALDNELKASLEPISLMLMKVCLCFIDPKYWADQSWM